MTDRDEKLWMEYRKGPPLVSLPGVKARKPRAPTSDVRRLVIAAREVWEQHGESGDVLDIALEAFAARVPYTNGPA